MSENSNDIEKVKTDFELIKLQKEIVLIENQTKFLQRSWYKRPEFISIFSPVIVGVLTVLIAWKSGFLQAQAKLNEIQEIEFNQKKDSIKKVIVSLSDKALSLENDIDQLKEQKQEVEQLRNVFNNKFLNAEKKQKILLKKYFRLQEENQLLQKINMKEENLRIQMGELLDRYKEIRRLQKINDSLEKINQEKSNRLKSLNEHLKLLENK